MARDGRYTVLRFERGGETVDGWVTNLDEDNHAIDFELGNHYTAMHPDSIFRQLIMMSIVTPDGRVSLMNRDATLHRRAGVETRQIADRRAFRAFLVEHYGFDLPEFDTLHVPAIPEWAL